MSSFKSVFPLFMVLLMVSVDGSARKGAARQSTIKKQLEILLENLTEIKGLSITHQNITIRKILLGRIESARHQVQRLLDRLSSGSHAAIGSRRAVDLSQPWKNTRLNFPRRVVTHPLTLKERAVASKVVKNIKLFKFLEKLDKTCFDDYKMTMIKDFIKNRHFTALQTIAIIRKLSFSERMVKIAIMLYPKVVDKRNFHKVILSIPYEPDRLKLRSIFPQAKPK